MSKDDSFGARLRRARERAGLLRYPAAERIGIAPRTLAALERDERTKYYSILPGIARAYGCSIDSLFPEMDGREAAEGRARDD